VVNRALSFSDCVLMMIYNKIDAVTTEKCDTNLASHLMQLTFGCSHLVEPLTLHIRRPITNQPSINKFTSSCHRIGIYRILNFSEIFSKNVPKIEFFIPRLPLSSFVCFEDTPTPPSTSEQYRGTNNKQPVLNI